MDAYGLGLPYLPPEGAGIEDLLSHSGLAFVGNVRIDQGDEIQVIQAPTSSVA